MFSLRLEVLFLVFRNIRENILRFIISCYLVVIYSLLTSYENQWCDLVPEIRTRTRTVPRTRTTSTSTRYEGTKKLGTSTSTKYEDGKKFVPVVLFLSQFSGQKSKIFPCWVQFLFNFWIISQILFNSSNNFVFF